jgi:hypothetical protein
MCDARIGIRHVQRSATEESWHTLTPQKAEL